MNHIQFVINAFIIYENFPKCKRFLKFPVKTLIFCKFGWGGRFRTLECGSQSPMPYHLATPQRFWAKNIWLGWQDSNLRMIESKSIALPLGYTPKFVFNIWGGRWVSNPRPQDPQSCALTYCATSTI